MISEDEFNILAKIILKHGKQLHTYRAKNEKGYTITSSDDRTTVMDFNFTLVSVFHGCFNRAIGVHLPNGKELIYSSWDGKEKKDHSCSIVMETTLRDLLTLKEDI